MTSSPLRRMAVVIAGLATEVTDSGNPMLHCEPRPCLVLADPGPSHQRATLARPVRCLTCKLTKQITWARRVRDRD